MRFKAFLLVVLLAPTLAACSSRNGPPPDRTATATATATASETTVVWTKTAIVGFPKTFSHVISSTYAGNTWYVVAQRTQDGNFSPVSVLASADGKRWHDVSPPNFMVAEARAFGFPQQVLATLHGKPYLLGSDGEGPAQIWSGTPGGSFTASVRLVDGTGASSNGDVLPVGLSSSGSCVYAAVLTYPAGAVHAMYGGAPAQKLEIFSLCDGRLSAGPMTFQLDRSTEWSDVKLAADGSGPVVFIGATVYRPEAGRLVRSGIVPQAADLVLGNNRTLVGVADASGAYAGPDGSARTRDYWWLDGTVTGQGQFPVGRRDAGTAPHSYQAVQAGCASDHGFVVAGFTVPGGGNNVAGMWWSADGKTWAKLPQQANHMQDLDSFVGVACSPTGATLVFSIDTSDQRNPPISVWTGMMPYA